MTEAPPTSTEDPAPADERVLQRSAEGRMITGVCAGLGRYAGIDPVLFRVGFAVLVLGSGIGIMLYIAAFLLMKDNAGRPGYVEQWTRRIFDTETVLALLAAVFAFGLIINVASDGIGMGTIVVGTLLAIALLAAHARGVDLLALAKSLPERIIGRRGTTPAHENAFSWPGTHAAPSGQYGMPPQAPYAGGPYAPGPNAPGPYSPDPYSRGPYAHGSYGRPPQAPSPYAQAPHQPYGQAPQGQAAYRQEPYGQGPHGPATFAGPPQTPGAPVPPVTEPPRAAEPTAGASVGGETGRAATAGTGTAEDGTTDATRLLNGVTDDKAGAPAESPAESGGRAEPDGPAGERVASEGRAASGERALAAEGLGAARDGVTMALTPPAPPAASQADPQDSSDTLAAEVPSADSAAPHAHQAEAPAASPAAHLTDVPAGPEASVPSSAEAPPRPPVTATPHTPGTSRVPPPPAGTGFRRLSDLAKEAGRGPYDYGASEPFAPHGPYAGYGRTPYPPVDSPYLREAEESAARPPARQPKSKSFIGGLTICLALIVGGIMVAVQRSTGSPSMPMIGGAVLATIGTGLLIATWFGRGAGLVAAGIIVSLALVAGSTLDGIPKNIGSFSWHPSEVTQPSREYAVGMGDGTLNLTDLPLDPGSHVRFDASVSVGRITVIVPTTARVEVHGYAKVGEVKIDHKVEDGMDVRFSRVLEPDKATGDAPTIELHVKAGIGDVEVRRGDDATAAEPRLPSSVGDREPPRPGNPPTAPPPLPDGVGSVPAPRNANPPAVAPLLPAHVGNVEVPSGA
ncbi:PspC domain-containing protein [Microtetraspora fusca]|uniref:PspC domain-containing protein n=1 Tax=Microtetraspora fusca TaxID=1997 RepID=UPI0008298D8D|nr:PspC domain-containing protein [Microtetraspora fusca]